MSHLRLDPSAHRLARAAFHRTRLLPTLSPLIDAPHTASALSDAARQWAKVTRAHRDAADNYWSEAIRFLEAIDDSDNDLARRLR